MTNASSPSEGFQRNLLVVPFLALLVAPIGTAAAAFQDAPGSYEGMVNGADGFPIVTTLSEGADGKISGTYEIDENGMKVTGKLVEKSRSAENRTILFDWTDPNGTGSFRLTFNGAFSEFSGYWSDTDEIDEIENRAWDGRKTFRAGTNELIPFDAEQVKLLFFASPDDEKEVVLTIKNSRDSAIAFYWFDYEGERVHYLDVKAGEEAKQSTFEGHYWVVVDGDNNALGIYETPGKDATIVARAEAPVPDSNGLPRIDPSKEKDLKSPEDALEVVLTIKNTLASDITTYWIDYDGDRVQYQDVKAGAEAEQITFEGHYWVMVDSDNNALGIYETPGKDATIIVAPEELPRIDPKKEKDITSSEEDGAEITLTIKNSTKGEVALYWIDEAGDRIHYHDIKAGAEIEQRSFEGHVWITVNQNSKALGIYRCTDQDGVILIK